MIYVEDVWKSAIVPFIASDPPSCEESHTIGELRSTCRFFHDLLTTWKPCIFRSGYCDTHQPLYCKFHGIVDTIYEHAKCHHITFENTLQRALFWAFLREQIKKPEYFARYMYVLSGFKDCCDKSISPRIEVVPPRLEMG